MKRFVSLLLSAVMMLSLAGCSGGSGDDASGSADKDGKYEIALITDHGSVDDKSFNQGAWEGVIEFAEKNGKSYKYFRPSEKSTDAYLNAINMAVKNGAKTVVCPGFLLETAVYKAQDTYPDVKFILLDGIPQTGDYTDYRTADNTYSIVYAEEQSGFLAGYAAVMDGFRYLGFMGGMSVPAVVRFGYGFCQGAQFAAEELGLQKDEVKIKYGYTGNFDPMPENQTMAASWYQNGVEVIFSCAALVLNNVTAAAEAATGEKYVIGVDVDQSAESKTVITSATKNLKGTVYNVLEDIYSDRFRGGKNDILGAKEDAVALPDDFSRFRTFKKEQYEQVYKKLKNNEDNLADSLIRDNDNGNKITLDELSEKLSLIKIEK